MHKLIRSFLLIMVPVLTACGQEASGTSAVTLGVGGTWAIESTHQLEGGPQFNGNYEYRLRKHWAVELGVNTTVTNIIVATTYSTISSGLVFTTNPPANPPSPVTITNYNYISQYLNGARVYALPFGVRYIFPRANGKVEWFAGLGGAYMLGPNNYSEWAITPNLGVRVAVDKQRHFWLGSTARYSKDFGLPQGQWVTWTADFGFRFGR